MLIQLTPEMRVALAHAETLDISAAIAMAFLDVAAVMEIAEPAAADLFKIVAANYLAHAQE